MGNVMVHPDQWSCLNDTEISERRSCGPYALVLPFSMQIVVHILSIVLFQGWSVSFKVIMYNVHFFSE